MKALVLEAVGQACVKEVERSLPKVDEVEIEVRAAGLCGSDFHIFHGTYPARYPLIPGHEFSGVITKVGEQVNGFLEGQRVIVDPNIYCNSCYYCLKNQKNMCEAASAVGVTRNGGFAEYVCVPATQVYLLPDSVSFEEGALTEPIACGIYGVNQLELGLGDRAVLFGAGPMGLLLLQLLLVRGASEIVVIEQEEARRNAALLTGAQRVYATIDELKQEEKRGFDAVIDATGQEEVIRRMFEVAGKRAHILQFGCAKDTAKVEISPYDFYNNDWKYIGSRTAVFTYEHALSLLSFGKLSVKEVITEEISLSTLQSYLEKGKPFYAQKIIVKPR